MDDEHPGPSSAHSLSILDVLRPPTRSELTRKRKVDSNPPPKGKRKGIMSFLSRKILNYRSKLLE